MKKLISLLCLIGLSSCGKEHASELERNLYSPTAEMIEAKNPLLFLPRLDQEQFYYALDNHIAIAQKNDSRYIDLLIKHNKSITNFNHINFEDGVREIKISAMHLKLGSDVNDHQVFKLLNNAKDIKSLIIEAETVEINQALFLPGTNIKIISQNVIFNHNAQIITTALDNQFPANAFQNGSDGHKSGDVTIVADKITLVNPNQIHIITSGANGQDAGPGMDGIKGADAQLVNGQYYRTVTTICRDYPNPGGHLTFAHNQNERLKSTHCEEKATNGKPAQNGQDARVGGRPGNAGEAGNIYINQDVNFQVQAMSGKAGKKDILRKGGAPGQPVTTCQYNFRWKRVENCVTAKVGAEVEPLEALIQATENKKLIVINDYIKYDRFIKTLYRYANDLYKTNQLEDAYEQFQKLQQLMKNVITKNSYHLTLETKAKSKMRQISKRKDYYGKNQTWTPNLALEVSYKAFDQEVERNLNLLFYTIGLKSKLINQDKKRAFIVNLQSELNDSIEQANQAINQQIHKTNELTKNILDMEVMQADFEAELKRVEKLILEQAKRDLSVPFHKKALNFIAAASKAIPVGQPTFGAIGLGIDFVNQLSEQNQTPTSILKNGIGLIDNFKGFKWNEATKELGEKLNTLSPSHIAQLNTNQARIDYIKNIRNFAGPIYQALEQQNQLYRQSEVNQSMLDQQINKIKASSPLYQNLIVKLNQLHMAMSSLRDQILSYQMEIDQQISQIHQDYSTLSASYQQLSDINKIESSEFHLLLDEIYHDAIDALNYYHYLLAKSYNYRFLKPYYNRLKLDEIFQKMEHAITLEQVSNISLEEVKLFYQRELSRLARNVIDQYSHDDMSIKLVKQYSLDEKQAQLLNEGKEIYIDLNHFFEADRDNLRLESIQVSNNLTTTSDEFEFVIRHSGLSVIEKNKVRYIFEHTNLNSQLSWISYKSSGFNSFEYSHTSEIEQNFVRELLNLNPNTEVLIKPAARSFYAVKLNKFDQGKVDNIKLLIHYTANIRE